jgi:hypothetical protein
MPVTETHAADPSQAFGAERPAAAKLARGDLEGKAP